MTITPRALNRATLARQLLLARVAAPGPAGAAETVRRVAALQAQHPASPYVALWNRVDGFDAADLDAAYAERRVVRSTLMRITLHTVHADDHRAFRAAMQPTLRGARLHDRRFTSTGFTAEEADALVPDLLALVAEPRSGQDVVAWIDERHPGHGKIAWWALRHYGPFVHAPTDAPWSFGARASWLPAPGHDGETDPDGPGPDDALPVLVRRYLEAFGPASVADVGQFLLVHRPRVRAAIAALGDELETLDGPDGVTLHDVRGAPRPGEDTPAPPRLLGMWDEVLLAHADRSRVVPPAYRRLVTQVNGDVLPAILVDGYVAGLWRTVDGPDGAPLVEAHAFEPLGEDVWSALAVEAAGLLTLLGARDPHPYRRHDRWWDRLPEPVQRRLLPR